MTGYEMRNETIDYLKKMLEKRKNELVLKMPEIYIKDIQKAYNDGLKSGLRHHSHDYLVKTSDLKKRYEKQKEINKELVDENEKLKEQINGKIR